MSKIHATTYDTSGNCFGFIHAPIPAGNNSVGNSWKAVWLAAGKNTTGMVTGTGIGQILAAEAAQIASGDVIEVPASIPQSVISQGAAAIDTFANTLIASYIASFKQQYPYYGWTSAT